MAKSKDWTIDIWDTKHVVKVLFNVNLLPVKRCPKNIFFTFPFSRGFPASLSLSIDYLLSFLYVCRSFRVFKVGMGEATRRRRSLITMRCIAWNLIYSKVFISSFYHIRRRLRRIIKCHKWLWFGFSKYTTYQKHRIFVLNSTSSQKHLEANISPRANLLKPVLSVCRRKDLLKSNEIYFATINILGTEW
jgi:hypothetical protein